MPQPFKEHATHDPFAITPDPNVYVPRSATETARRDLLRSACNPAKTTALIGPPGLGKTLLLHLLVKEAPEDLQTVYLPYAALPPEELCSWALGLLGLPGSEDPIEALRAHGRALSERGASLLLLIDDAGAMPIATARWAGELVRNSGGSVRLLIAASDNATGNRTIAAIGSNFDIVHFDEPMTQSETSEYIDGRLALARVPDSVRARFDTQTVRLLHRISAGIPRRLHSAAMAILQEIPGVAMEARAESASAAVEAPATPADASVESAASERAIDVRREERRVSNRRAQPEGVEVRVGLSGSTEPKGRRAEDREKAAPRTSESAAEEFDESAPIEAEVPDRKPPISRRILPASRRSIALGSLFIAFAAVAIPVIRSILSEPRPNARADWQGKLRESIPAALGAPSERIESSGSMARDGVTETGAVVDAAEPQIVASPVVAPPPAEPPELFAVQINATPWATVEVDGIDLGATPLANIPLFGGEHSFRVKMPDGRIIDRIVEIDADKRFISFE
ncbi:MAG: AAA family ATPase [Deltaproteobacteria bacterium]|jgi:type II secretory pathway predicted ATPase ExeA|nr:AAA family ATPase [Deltaproteobacteria bacterium]